jgi:uncharacterized membrane protein YgcG
MNPNLVVTGAYQEVHMRHWKRKILNAGVSLSVVSGGVLLAEGAANAHDAADHHGPAHHGVLREQVLRHRVQGVVASVGTGSFTITTHRGGAKTIATTSTTVFTETGTPIVPATVAIGQNVVVALDPANPTPTATRVVIVLDRVSGKVLDVSGTTLTLSGPRNSTHIVMVLSGTMFFDGGTSATGVTVGQFVTAFGNADPTAPTTFDAVFVDIGFSIPQPVGVPVVPPTVPIPNPGLGRGDDHGDHDNDGDNDFNDHANGDDNDANEHATTPSTGVSNLQPAAPETPSPTPGNEATGDDTRGGPGPSNGGGGGDNGGNGGHGDDGGGSSGGGSGSGGQGGRG